MTKHRLWRRYKRYPTSKTWNAYRTQRNKTTEIRRSSVRAYFKERTENGKKNEHFWTTIKPFVTNKGTLNSQELMIEHNDNIITNPKQVADIITHLSAHFFVYL